MRRHPHTARLPELKWIAAALLFPLLFAAMRTPSHTVDRDATEVTDEFLERARVARAALVEVDPQRGLFMRSDYIFELSNGTEQVVKAILFLSSDGQLSQTLNAGRLGSAKQLLGLEEAWAEQSAPDADGKMQRTSGFLDSEGLRLLRARALIYEAVLRFPYAYAEGELERLSVKEDPTAVLWKLRRAGLDMELFCHRESGLPFRISIPICGLTVHCGEWVSAPPSCWPPTLLIPRHWRWIQVTPANVPPVREELEELQFDVSCPLDLLEAQLGSDPGEKVHLDPTRATRARERWSVRTETPYRASESFALSASGFAQLLRRLGQDPAANLDPGPVTGPLLAWQAGPGRLAILNSASDAEAEISRGAEGVVTQVADPLDAAAQLGFQLQTAPISNLIWAPAEEAGPFGVQYTSFRVVVLR